MISYGISEIVFIDGTSELLPPTGIVVIVGANNAGKSVLLREIYESSEGYRNPHTRRWIEYFRIARSGSEEEFKNWFNEFSRLIPVGRAGEGNLGYWSDQLGITNPLPIEHAVDSWVTGRDMGALKRRMVGYFPAMNRESLIGSPGVREVMTPPMHPIHQVWDSVELERDLSRLINQAFGFPVCINRYVQNPTLMCGQVDLPNEPLPPSRELLEAYGELTPVSEQGDGIKSFSGLVLHTMTAGTLVSLIDEPEAFLHPPQARLLGRFLARETPRTGQVIIATHSSDVLEGVLDGATDREVKVIRLTQESGTGIRRWNTLNPTRVSQLWQDPLLRYSHLLDGLFHKGIVICEADTDCRFYAATVETYLDDKVEHDLVFTHVGGKGRLARAAREMKDFHIQVAVIGDLDVLRQEGQVEALVAAMGGDSSDFSNDLRIIREQVRSRRGGALVSDVREVVKDVLARRADSRLTDDEVKSIVDAVRIKSGWDEVKRAGIRSFVGDAFRAVDTIVNKLAKMGVFLVPVGELERWYPEVEAGHGAPYVTKVLEGGHHRHLSSDLTSFLDGLCRHFGLDIGE